MYAYLYLVLHIFRLLLDLLATQRLSGDQKDLEILLLRHQLRVLQRKLPNSKPPRISMWRKAFSQCLLSNIENAPKGLASN